MRPDHATKLMSLIPGSSAATLCVLHDSREKITRAYRAKLEITAENYLHVDELLPLKTRGYVVVDDVLSTSDCMHAKELFFSWMEEVLGIPRDDDRLLQTPNWFANIHGIIKHYGAGQTAFMWYLRSHPHVQRIFRKIWALDDDATMVTSFDGMSVVRPPENSRRATFHPAKTWLHVDQTPETSANTQPTTQWGAKCIQGAVNIMDSTEHDACLYVLENSHLLHKKFFKHHAHEWKTTPKGDFFMLSPAHIAWYEQHGCTRVAVPVKHGSMTLWDSRLVHCGKAPSPNRHTARWRLTAFVCMVPSHFCTPNVKKRRQKAVQDNRTTCHWPHKPRVNAKKPRETHIKNIPYKELDPQDVDHTLV